MPTLELADWKASYQENGVGLPIVFIPGITEYKESFHYQLRGLADRFRIISYDVRAAEGSPCTIESLAADLGRLLDGLRLPNAVIVGHGFGGLIAQQFACENPERTTALILISTFAKSPEQSQSKLLRYMSSGQLKDPGSPWRQMMVSMGLAKPAEVELEPHLDWVALQAAKTSQKTIKARIDVIRKFDSRPWLDRLWMPLLLLAGEHDRPPFLSAAQFVQRSTLDSVVDVIPDAGHFPHIERHDLVNMYIDDFIGSRLTSLVD